MGEDDPITSPPSGPAEGRLHPVYPIRWAVLVTVVVLNISNAALWINISAVATTVGEYYGKELWQVNWFSLSYLFISVPFCFVATFSVNKLGLAISIQLGALLNLLGAFLRAIATSGIIDEAHMETQFALSLTGQTIAGMSQPFLLFIPTKVSQLWFPVDQRALSTTIGAMSNPLGIVIAMVVSPSIVSSAADIPLLNYVFLGPAILAEVLALAFVRRSKPPTPPSHSSARGELERPAYLQQLRITFTCVPYLLLLLSLGMGIGFFSAMATVTQQILCPLGYTDTFAGLAAAVMILCGFAGSAFTGILADKTKAFTPIVKYCYGAAAILGVIMLELYLVPDVPVALAIFCGLFGFFGVGTYPVGLELAVETTYPVEETISTAFIFMGGQFLGVLIIAIVSLLGQEMRPEYAHLQVCTTDDTSSITPMDYTVSMLVTMALLCVVVVLTIGFFDTPYKRLEAEKANPSISSSSSLSQPSSNSLTSHDSLASPVRPLGGGEVSGTIPDVEATSLSSQL